MRKILIADDDREFRELIAFALRFAGYEVRAVSNGEEIYLMAKQYKPDLILMGVYTPKMIGYEACAAIKADMTTSSIPMILLSEKGEEFEDQACKQEGGVDYILKPISPDRLTKKVSLYLRRASK